LFASESAQRKDLFFGKYLPGAFVQFYFTQMHQLVNFFNFLLFVLFYINNIFNFFTELCASDYTTISIIAKNLKILLH